MENKFLKISYRLAKIPDECSLSDKTLLIAAEHATQSSHSPYSKFRVGAALLLEDDSIIEGSNQENASFPVGFCAERTALSAKVAIAPNKKIKTIAIRVKSALKVVNQPAAPCGICRQVLLEAEEAQNQNIKVVMQGESGPILIFESIKDLVPFYFGADDF
ncbi:MAG: cytidine deaminase [Chitinophagales bacterium]|nr:cytidine deaminase [Chitinophagales bacterium]